MARPAKYDEPMQTITVKLRSADVEWMDSRAKERGLDRSAMLRLVLDRFRAVGERSAAGPPPTRSREVTPIPKGKR